MQNISNKSKHTNLEIESKNIHLNEGVPTRPDIDKHHGESLP